MKITNANLHLKECPFCGGNVKIEILMQYPAERDCLTIYCEKCDVRMNQRFLPEESAVEVLFDRWNGRA